MVVITDRGDLYMPRMAVSLAEYVGYQFSSTHVVDDHDHELGLAGAVNAGWSAVPDGTDYVFHVEEDFVFTAPVNIDAMAATLAAHPHLAQMVLQRQFEPNNPVEAAARSVISPGLGEWVDRGAWVEHTSCFSLNPCLIPYAITSRGWPAGNEAEMTARCVDDGLSFAFWGNPGQSPAVLHIGKVRSSGWRL